MLLRSVLVLAVLGLTAFYVLTIPSTLPADALKPRTADLANGELPASVRTLVADPDAWAPH